MNLKRFRTTRIFAAVVGTFGLAATVHADPFNGLVPGDLLVTASTYVDPGFAVGTPLPIASGATATVGSAFCGSANCSVNVWNNDGADANFGITSGITLQSLNARTGTIGASFDVTAAAARQGLSLVTSFSSKSELGINMTPDAAGLTFMGYQTTPGRLDVSNSQAPGGADKGNIDIATPTPRTIAQLDLGTPSLQQTTTSAFSGNNGRAAIRGANGLYYAVGNAGNGGAGDPVVASGGGVQAIVPGSSLTRNEIGAYTVTQNGYPADKVAKDSNFRGETIYNGTLYVTKGSGGNGINTVYQVGAAGVLPTGTGSATPVAVLPGLSTTLAAGPSSATAPVYHPFGLFFANASTMYVADEGSGDVTDFGADATTQIGGLQKYSLVDGIWKLDYILAGSLIGRSYTVQGTGALAGISLTTTVDGLRNLTGMVNADGTVTLFAATATAGSQLADAGADPNQIVSITDTLSFMSAAQAAGEDFTTLETASLGQVLRGVALNPAVPAVPEPASSAMLLMGLAALGVAGRRHARQRS